MAREGDTPICNYNEGASGERGKPRLGRKSGRKRAYSVVVEIAPSEFDPHNASCKFIEILYTNKVAASDRWETKATA